MFRFKTLLSMTSRLCVVQGKLSEAFNPWSECFRPRSTLQPREGLSTLVGLYNVYLCQWTNDLDSMLATRTDPSHEEAGGGVCQTQVVVGPRLLPLPPRAEPGFGRE